MDVERLEPRAMLSGVTLITHGFGGSVDDWITAMADAIVARPDLAIEQPRYRVEVTDPGHDGGPLAVSNPSRSGPAPADCLDSAEIVILLNWSDVAGTLSFGGGYHRSTRDVAAAVAARLVAADFLTDFAFPLAQLPFHLIGHSRGASLVGELAKQLGERGVWVDQVTTLDPHPVDGVREPTFFSYDFGDAPMTSWNNVVYWDNYWRSDGAGSFDFTGETVVQTANLQLSESVLTGSGYTLEHSDVHLWYHGTVDTSPTASDGDAAVPSGWYGGVHPPRDSTGYYYSRVVGGARLAAGVASSLGGGASRSSVAPTAAAWPNLLELQVVAPQPQIFVGAPIPTSFFYQDVDSSATIAWFLDADRNPYNSNQVDRNQQSFEATTTGPASASAEVDTLGMAPGTYYVAARISDPAGRLRYAYAPQSVVLAAPPNLVVDNTLDSGPGSLRQAILDAQATPGLADTITFALAPGTHEIQLASMLPALLDPTILIVPSGQTVQVGLSSPFTLGSFVDLTKAGAGTLALGGELTTSITASLQAATGSLRLAADLGAGLDLSASGPDVHIELAATQHLAKLRLANGAAVAVVPGGDRRVVVDELAIDETSRLDLADGALAVQATPATRQGVLADLAGLLASGFAGGLWNGPGVASQTAAADASHQTALGYLLNANALGEAIHLLFADEPVHSSSVLVRYAWYGDANLDRVVDAMDYALIDNGFNANLAGWRNGDANYDGLVDGTDYAIIDNVFNQQTGPLAVGDPIAVGLVGQFDSVALRTSGVATKTAVSGLTTESDAWPISGQTAQSERDLALGRGLHWIAASDAALAASGPAEHDERLDELLALEQLRDRVLRSALAARISRGR